MGAHIEQIRAQLSESCRVKQSFSEELLARVETFAVRAAEALAGGRKLVFFGNGGSAADAQHLAAELVDYGFEQIFSRQIESLVERGDILVAISTSGMSPNIVRGVEAGARRGTLRVALTGETGGALADKVDLLLNVPSRDAQRIQEAHITIGHIACSLIEEIRFGKKT